MFAEKSPNTPKPEHAQKQWVMPTDRWDPYDLLAALASLSVPLERRFEVAYCKSGFLEPESLITSISCQSEGTINRAIQSYLENNPSAIRFVA